MFEISTLKFVKNESLTPTVSFGIGSAFSKVPRSAFSEGPGQVRVHFIKYAEMKLRLNKYYKTEHI